VTGWSDQPPIRSASHLKRLEGCLEFDASSEIKSSFDLADVVQCM
jgi:hypothetical protein